MRLWIRVLWCWLRVPVRRRGRVWEGLEPAGQNMSLEHMLQRVWILWVHHSKTFLLSTTWAHISAASGKITGLRAKAVE